MERIYRMNTCIIHKTAVLGIELIDIALRKLVAARSGNHLCRDALALLRKHIKRSGAHPAVNQQYRLFSPSNQLFHQRTRIPQLPFVEHSLQRRLSRLHKEIDFVLQNCEPVIVL